MISGELLAAPAGPAGSTARAETPASAPPPAQTDAPQGTTQPEAPRDTAGGAAADTAAQQTSDTVVQRTPDPKPSPAENAQLDSLAAILAASPISDVYLAPADTLAVGALDRVRVALAGSGVEVHDLTACYQRTPSGPCHADVAESTYRLIGFPALRGAAADTARAVSILRASIDAASAAERTALVVAAADPSFARPPAEPDSSYGATSAGTWNAVLRSERVAALLYGSGLRGAGEEGKVKRSPPLGGSGAAPRGMALIDLADRRAVSHTLSYDAATGSVAGGRSRGNAAAAMRTNGSSHAADDPRRLATDTIEWIAILAAVLTVAALWKIPEPSTPGPAGTGDPARTLAATPGSAMTIPFLRGQNPGGSVFESNLGRTVVSGLTGIAIVTVLTDVWNSNGINAQALYLTTFIKYFLVLLCVSAAVRGGVEAFRTNLASGYRPFYGSAATRDEREQASRGHLYPALQVFFDTALNVLLGQNQAESVVWERRFIQQQNALLATIDRVREEVSATWAKRCRARAPAPWRRRISV